MILDDRPLDKPCRIKSAIICWLLHSMYKGKTHKNAELLYIKETGNKRNSYLLYTQEEYIFKRMDEF